MQTSNDSTPLEEPARKRHSIRADGLCEACGGEPLNGRNEDGEYVWHPLEYPAPSPVLNGADLVDRLRRSGTHAYSSPLAKGREEGRDPVLDQAERNLAAATRRTCPNHPSVTIVDRRAVLCLECRDPMVYEEALAEAAQKGEQHGTIAEQGPGREAGEQGHEHGGAQAAAAAPGAGHGGGGQPSGHAEADGAAGGAAQPLEYRR